MRLGDWRDASPRKESMGPKVLGVIDAALALFGSDADPECWTVWGDDPAIRYLILVPISSGLIQLNVRVNVPGEGPRAAGKLIRWNRVQTGELMVELQGGHKLVSFNVENAVIHAQDAEAEDVSLFARIVYDGIDGRGVASSLPDAQGAMPMPGPGGRRQAMVPRLPAPRGADD
jgi:hypothetical protein